MMGWIYVDPKPTGEGIKRKESPSNPAPFYFYSLPFPFAILSRPPRRRGGGREGARQGGAQQGTEVEWNGGIIAHDQSIN